MHDGGLILSRWDLETTCRCWSSYWCQEQQQ
jgi:hypothetical protein